MLAAVFPLLLGGLALAGWATGMLRLASLHHDYIPMAPSTALAFLVLNGSITVLAFRSRRAFRPIVDRFIGAIAACLLGLAVVRVIEVLGGTPTLGIEARLVASPASFGAVPLARMSALTAAALMLAALSLASLTFERDTTTRTVGGLLGIAVGMIGFSIVLGYAYGAPLLYGGPLIPAALTTGLAFVGTGTALGALSGPDALPMRWAFGNIARVEIAESQMRDMADRTAFALEAAGAGTWEYDMTSGTLEWSPAISRMMGLPFEPVRTDMHGFRKGVHPEDWPLVDAAVRRALDGHVAYRAQYRIARPDGTTGWIQSKGRVTRDASGAPVAIIGIAMDITDRKQLEQHLQQSQKLEALGRLAGSIAHDFNNVLTAIVGFSELLQQDMGPAHPRARDVAEIKKAGEAGERLVKQLLAFSRKQPLRPVELDVNVVVANTKAILERLAGLNVRVDTALHEAPRRVWADAGQIQQILVNLAVNARDAMPYGGTLTVATFEANVGRGDAERHEVAPGCYTVLSVSDTGTGMSEEIRARIFEPFFTTKEPDSGTGLGLATVYGIVRQSGGFIDVKSEIGVGTTFLVHLPHRHQFDAAD